MTGERRATMSNKAKFSAAMLALLAAGASAPVLMDQFLTEKEGVASPLIKTALESGPFVVAPLVLMVGP